MRKVTAILATFALILALAAPALAEHNAAHVRAGSDGGPCMGGKSFEATRAGDPGEGSLRCFATQAEADYYHTYGESGPGSASPSASPSPSPTASPTASPSSDSQYAEALPATGGTSPLGLAAAVLLFGGLVAVSILRRS